MDKSVFDGMKTKEMNLVMEAKEGRILPKGGSGTAKSMDIVGHCPQCGSPIYGPSQAMPDSIITVKHSCPCHFGRKAE